MCYEFKKLNRKPIKIQESIRPTNNDVLSYDYFIFKKHKYYIEEFLNVRSPWISGEYPSYIHGIEYKNYYNPIYIEIVDGEFVNVYCVKNQEELK